MLRAKLEEAIPQGALNTIIRNVQIVGDDAGYNSIREYFGCRTWSWSSLRYPILVENFQLRGCKTADC